MANYDQPQGLRPYGDVKSLNVYQSGSAVYPGDALKRDANGQVVPVAVDGSAYAASCCGVAMSYASASGQDVIVSDNPNQYYIVQADSTEIDAQTDMNLNYKILATAPDTTYKKSLMELQSSSAATTATYPLRLISIYRDVKNALGAQVDCIVKINAHEQNSVGTDGI